MGIQRKVPAGELIMSSLSECDKPAATPLWKAGDGSPGAVAFHHGELAEVPGPLPAWQLKSGGAGPAHCGAHRESGLCDTLLVCVFCLEPWGHCICQTQDQVENWGEERKVSLTAPISN